MRLDPLPAKPTENTKTVKNGELDDSTDDEEEHFETEIRKGRSEQK